MNPLADRIRPMNLDDVFGQEHLIGEGKILRNIIEKNDIPNMIFYGPSGVGKTTIANIIAARTGKQIHRLNATTASVSDIKDIVKSLDSIMAMNGVLLYLDEIQHFNKKQQQSLLEFMENGKITLIASTTENPYFYIYNAVLSRSVVFEFKPLSPENIEKALLRAVGILKENDYKDLQIEDGVISHIANTAGGDIRKALNSLEVSALASVPDKNGKIKITLDTATQATQKKSMRFDRDGDSHYDILSAFQKSMRGSDPDAAVYYLARLLDGGDMQSAIRRMLVCAAEDVGLAYPQALMVAKAAADSALMLGMPEARIPLAEAVILIATSPKSNSAIGAIDSAMQSLSNIDTGEIPSHLKDSHYGGAKKLGHGTEYKYPHSFKNHYVPQQYLPDNIKDTKFYIPGENKNEAAAKKYWDTIKSEHRK